jgi:hypothetical protein
LSASGGKVLKVAAEAFYAEGVTAARVDTLAEVAVTPCNDIADLGEFRFDNQWSIPVATKDFPAATLWPGKMRVTLRRTRNFRLTARAGVSKPALYAQFGSERALVAAVPRRRHEAQRRSLEAHLTGVPGGPPERLLTVFDWLAGWHAEAGWRGCAFLTAPA